MSDLLTDTLEARLWAHGATARHEGGIYGLIAAGVIWTDARAADGSLIVEASPDSLLRALALEPLQLLHNHDPGRPICHVLEAAAFQAQEGQRFVAAILGYYTRDQAVTFSDLQLDQFPGDHISESNELDANTRIEISWDPRELPDGWVEDAVLDAPLPVEETQLSLNASESIQELVRIGIGFAFLVWNPLVKGFATEAGKAAYSSFNNWLKEFIARASKRKAPLVCIDSNQQDCHVIFLIRGNDISVNYAAHEALSQAATEGANLISALARRGTPASKLVYEFDAKALRWFPSYAVLDGGRIITSTPMLIATASDLPTGLSLGMNRSDMVETKQSKH
ncbi:hypothetical protein [Xanthomonas hortorum]|uniref:hypothetical protein n=1 Tax=Xanthomonas hortorum TaxID=56454 RepID=UPI002935C50B|nr:hypothetical protein [Xanthomonas hortorum]MDV2452474.1 hypothetical protein [Xanthomonas hortorum NBC5720]